MSDSHSFTLSPVPGSTYDRVTSALSSLGHMTGNEIRILGTRLRVRYDRETLSLTIIILSKPMLASTGFVEQKVREWLKGQGVG